MFYCKKPNDIFTGYAEMTDILDLPSHLTAELDKISKEALLDSRLVCASFDAFNRIFSDDCGRSEAVKALNEFNAYLKENYSISPYIVNIFLFTAASGRLAKKYAEKNLPKSVLKATLRDIRIWCEHYYRENGVYGLSETGWLMMHFKMKLFRIGRLQYVYQKSTDDYFVFENKSGKFCAAARAGIPLNAFGEWDERFAVAETVFTESDSGYTVNIASKDSISIEPITLNKSEWSLAVSPCDNVLDMHIPEDGKLDFNECFNSMKQAQLFFKEYFNVDIKGFTVMSWLADEALRKILPETSNIAGFQRLYDVRMMSKSGAGQTVQRVFGDKWQKNIANAPENTSLQRNVKNSMLKGVKFSEYYGIRKAFEL